MAQPGVSPFRASKRSGAIRSRLASVYEIGVLDELKQARSELEKAAPGQTALLPAIRALRRTELRLERPLRVGVIGEFNSGKSTLTNLLARTESLPTAVVSNTCIPTLLYHAPHPEVWAVFHDGRRQWLRASSDVRSQDILRLEVGLPSERLLTIQILDLPGLADARFDGSVDELPCQAMDVAVWCTLSTQAWKESERVAWELLPKRLRVRCLLVATHCDLLRDPRDLEKLLCRLRSEAGPSFRDILPMSTTDALGVMWEDHGGAAGAVWKASGASALETALFELLLNVRRERAQAALKVTGRIAAHTLSRIGSSPVKPRSRAR